MKIGVKITLIAVVAVVALLISAYVGSHVAMSISDMFTYCGDVPIKNLNATSVIHENIREITAANALYFLYKDNPEKIRELTDEIEACKSRVNAMLDFLDTNATEKGRKYVNAFKEKIQISGATREKITELVKAGEWEEARELRIHKFQKEANETLEVISAYNEYTNQHALEFCYATSEAEAKYATKVLYATTTIVTVILIALSFFIIRGITKPLRKAVAAANHVADGDMNVDLKTNAKDETGILMQSLETMVASIKQLIKDSETLSNAAIAGNLEVRADASIHKGAYQELVSGFNKTLDAVIGPLNLTAEYVDRIAKGDIPPKITSNYNGDFNEIKNNLNACIDAVGLLVIEIDNSINQALEGNLRYRADSNKHKGDYSKIMNGVNELVDAFVEPLKVASDFLYKTSIGSNEIQKVTQEYKGDFNIIKKSINKMHDVLFNILGEMSLVAEAAKKGNLDAKADTSKVQGSWVLIMEGLNHVTEASGAIINDAGAVLSTMATGDLTPRITKNYPGKFGEMRDNINNLGDSLTDLISRLQEAIHTTASASAQISSTADTLATATQEQSAQTDEVASAIEEMSRTVTNNAQSATKTAEVAKHSGDVANNGGRVVRQTVEKMHEIATVVKTSAENITKLGASSKKIGEIISVIDDIADQTNLLSLNAAIEAARAGEQGRGFAVVADSVGKLAINTASATKEIAEMISGIQVDTDAAVKAMEKGTVEVQSGIELADNAGFSLQDILTGINDLLNMVNQIAAASEQQSATSEQISKNVSSISKVVADSARNIEDVATTANELAKMTEVLSSLVSQFKVNSSKTHSMSSSGRYLE